MAKVLQIETRQKAAEDSPLTPEMKEFIDNAIVPILVKQYLTDQESADELAERGSRVAESPRTTAALFPGR